MMNSKAAIALAASALWVSAVTAQTLSPGARPPVMPASATQQPMAPLAVPGLSAARAPATVTPPAGSPPGVIAQTVAATPTPTPTPHRVNRPRGLVQPPPADITLQSGVNATMGIAYAHTNRIVTPFANPEVKTNSTAPISVEGSIVYVSTNADDPISMFIHEHGRGDPAISVTLVPEEIPAISTTIHLFGVDPSSAMEEVGAAKKMPAAGPASIELAHSFESSNPYVETLLTLMKDLAHERVPDGYNLEVLRGRSALMPLCDMPGIRIEPAQLLTGGAYQVIVARASNSSTYTASLREDACGEQARAVAAWPRRVLQPGESTELYVVLARASEDDHSSVRPSVTGAR